MICFLLLYKACDSFSQFNEFFVDRAIGIANLFSLFFNSIHNFLLCFFLCLGSFLCSLLIGLPLRLSLFGDFSSFVINSLLSLFLNASDFVGS